MRKIIAMLLAAMMCFVFVGCQSEEKEPTVSRTFIAGYEAEGKNGKAESCRVLMNLMSDGKVEFYVGSIANGEHSKASYSGTYTLGENEEYDETISFEYTYGDGKTAKVEDAVIIDNIFEASFFILGEMTSNEISFYESKPAAMDGDVYVGYKTKTGGMGAMVYAYSLCIRNDNTFDVSIMQMASVMHVWGGTSGTYSKNGESIDFTYNVLTDEGEIVAEDIVSAGSEYTSEKLYTAFNIQQASTRATDAYFIRVK